MNLVLADAGWYFEERFTAFKHGISLAGLTAFVICAGVGLGLSTLLQSEAVRKLLTRLRIEKNLASIITSLLSLVSFAGLVVLGIEFAGVPIPWAAPIPGLSLSPVQIINLILWVVVVIWFSSASKGFMLKHFLGQSGLDRGLQYTLAQITGYVMLGLGLVIALQNVGVNLSALAVFAGALGVGLGLGLQTVAANFISGLVILAERPIKVGDRITVDGTTGQVHSIRVRATTIVTNDNIAVIIPNSRIIGNNVTNWNYGGPRVRVHVPVVVSYGSDVSRVKDLMLEAAKAHSAVLEKPAATVRLEGFAENLINLELIVWTEEMIDSTRRLKSDLNFAIEEKLRLNGIGKFKVLPVG